MSMNTYIRPHEVFGDCLYADNGIVEIGIPLELGIRIVHFACVGEVNVFYQDSAESLQDGFNVYGGHRLWIAPECEADYQPDNAPITYRIINDTIELIQQPTDVLRVEKRVLLRLDGDCVHVAHTIKNYSFKPIVCALWGVTALKGGGVESIDLHTREGGLDPLHHLTVWDHTNVGDPRISFTRDSVTVTHLPIEGKAKIGIGHPKPIVRYAVDGYVFTKQYEIDQSKKYPDGGVSFETFVNRNMLEMESLSPLRTVWPFAGATHTEIWSLRHQ